MLKSDAKNDWKFQRIKRRETEIGYGTSVERLRMSRDQVDEHVTNMYNMLKNTIQ